MHPRRLLVFLVVFAIVAVGYWGVAWHQERTAKAERAARRLFPVKEADITEIVLKKAGHEIRLVRQEQTWVITQPLAAKADKETVQQAANLLATLERERDLGEEMDPQAHGLNQPALVVEFTAAGKTHRLLLGNPTPGDLGFYVMRDDDRRLFTVAQALKETLDRPVDAFRDKAIFDFRVENVVGVTITAGPTRLDLEKTAAGAWVWRGRDDFKVRKDRLESLLRHLTLARVKEFLTGPPTDPASLGFLPVATAEISIALPDQPPQTLIVGSRRQHDFYARRGGDGPLFLVEADLAQRILGAMTSLEDRRLWSGDLGEVARLDWGAPGQLWRAAKEKDDWKLTGPTGQTVRQPSVRLEAALIKLQELEIERLLPAPPAGKSEYLVEVWDASPKLRFRLVQTGKAGKEQLAVRVERSGKPEGALLKKADLEQWQADIARLTQPPAADQKDTAVPEPWKK